MTYSVPLLVLLGHRSPCCCGRPRPRPGCGCSAWRCCCWSTGCSRRDRPPSGSTRLAVRARAARRHRPQHTGRHQHRDAARARAPARRLAALGRSERQPRPLDLAGGASTRLVVPRDADQARRAASRPGHGALARTAGLVSRQRSTPVPGAVRSLPRSSRRSTCPAGWRCCASSTGAPRCACAGRARSSTRCGSTSVATTSAASTGAPPHATAPSSYAPGSPSATGASYSCSTPPARRPRASATCLGSTPRWTPRCCSPRCARVPATASTSSPATAACGPRSEVGRGSPRS